ncbi:hypothetical protein ISCGN_005475 [Ixodes scapularis]
MFYGFITRLYYYPRKVMYAATTGLFMKQVFPSYFFALDCLLTVLLLMNLYWFILIVLFAVRVLTGDIKELDDTREYDVAQKLDKKGVLANGAPPPRFITRLYYYPRKVMYAATTGLFMKQVFPSYFFALDCLLTVLLLMNLYWFILIVLFAVRVLTGDIKELDDTREYDVAQKLDKKGVLANGAPPPSPTKKLENGNGCHNGATSWPGPRGDSGTVRERRTAAES